MAYNLAFRVWSAFCNGIKYSQFHHQKDDNVDMASDDSFPASDAPSWTKTTSQKTKS